MLQRFLPGISSSQKKVAASGFGPDGSNNEAFHNVDSFPNVLQPIVLDYIGGDIPGDAKTTMTLFGRNIQQLQASRKAQEVVAHGLLGNADAAEEEVRKNPYILHCVIPKIIDPRPRRSNPGKEVVLMRDKTVLQVMGAAGEFNYKEMKAEDKQYGIVERLSRYLPLEEVKKQLRAQFPPGWEKVTGKRLEAYTTALTTFAEGIIKTQVPAGSTVKTACEKIITLYWNALEAAANREVTVGLIICSLIYYDGIKYFIDHFDDFGGWNEKSHLYWIVGYGSAQSMALGDKPLIRRGLRYVFECGASPDRSFADSYYLSNSTSGLGRSFLICDDGGHVLYKRPGLRFCVELILYKTTNIEKLILSHSKEKMASSISESGGLDAVVEAKGKQINDKKVQNPVEALSTISAVSTESIELIPKELVIMIALLNSGAKEIIFHYLFNIGDMDDQKNYVWLKQPAAIHTFLGIPTSQKQILALVKYAGPLDQIEHYILKAHTRQESHLQATLMQAISIAVIGLDQDIEDEEGNKLDHGMVQKLLTLYEELFPNDLLKALEIVKRAAPLETEGAKEVREKTNVEAMNQLFNAFVQNCKDTLPAAINTFNDFIKDLKLKLGTVDNRYYLNLMHLIFVAFDVPARRGGELPALVGERNGQWSGKLANRFRIEIIAAVIQSNLPHRQKQLLRSGIYYLFEKKKEAAREPDFSDVFFHGDSTNDLFRVRSYYDDKGRGINSSTDTFDCSWAAQWFLKIYISTYKNTKGLNLLCRMSQQPMAIMLEIAKTMLLRI
ncbi:hypothetical protein AYO45_04755 [Gammaproteobacteria bacterium SCGC AG-212-F23]|nr:hypothetical protein AYO45_04755 [Gammaproteobacteria bacterium SCGC AG-212-F23]